MIRVGIADCHGIESYMDEETVTKTAMWVLTMRAQANRQRCALVYKAEVNKKLDALIQKALANKEFEIALRLLKGSAKVSLEDRPTAKEHWKLIPNAKLDAFF